MAIPGRNKQLDKIGISSFDIAESSTYRFYTVVCDFLLIIFKTREINRKFIKTGLRIFFIFLH